MHSTEIICNFAGSNQMFMETINLEKIKTQMRKGVLEMCILSIIHKKKEAYASDIMVEGTLYPLMTRLKNASLLNYSWRESTEGPPRKYYTLTDKGLSFLNEALASWNELQTMITKLI